MRPVLLLHRYATATACAAFLLLVAGGLVTSTDSGLAVPDWPLSYGTWFPPMVGGIRYEHGHRMLAAFVGLFIVILAGWLHRAEGRRWVRRLGDAALGAVILQGALGGLTVLWLLPPPVSVAHACLGPTVFCLLVCLAHATSPSWVECPARVEDLGRPSRGPRASRGVATEVPQPAVGCGRLSLPRLGVAVAWLAGGQLLLGAILRHTGYGLVWHLLGAVVLVTATAWLTVQAHRAPAVSQGFANQVRRLAALLAVQLLVGWGAWQYRDHVGLTTAHVAVGSLVLAQSVLVAWQACRWLAWQPLILKLKSAAIPEHVTQ